ncbi:TPA: AAA family ATPase, partial [Serratia fonticola]
SAIADDYTFPFFELELYNGITYSNTDMGMGEFSVLYIIWFMYFCERNSILFIEEPENYISASTQRYLMDKIAEIADAKNIWITISTHSEHILSKINIENTKVLLKKITTDVTQLVEPEHRERYLMALGLTPQIKGIIFVEDSFAEKFLTYLLTRYAGYILKNHKIVPIRCDSNIEKIVLHYQPQKDSPLNYIGIFDADQKEKISKYIGNEIFVSALPGKLPLSPEVLVWNVFIENVQSISKSLNISIDSLGESMEENKHINYHDRYQYIANDIGKPLDVLIDNLLNLWLEDEGNEKLSKDFIQCLINSHTTQKITITKISDDNIEFIVNNSTYSVQKTSLMNPLSRQVLIGSEFDVKIYFNSESLVILI